MQVTEPQARSLRSLLLLLVVLAAGVAGQARAQSPFDAAIRVNDDAITYYEIEQRARMLRLFAAPGDPQRLAREQLIDDRLRLQAARAAGIAPSEEDIRAGMEDFARRANLPLEDFLRALAANGVSGSTFREFVRAGVAWREVVRRRFANRAEPTQGELQRALASASTVRNIRVLLSEIILPAPPERAEEVQALALRLSEISTFGEFASAARQYSAAPSAARGGRLEWRNLAELPPGLQGIVLSLAPGEVSPPIPLNNAIVLFQLRDIDETGYTPPEYAAIEYATIRIPGGRSEAARTRAARIGERADRCEDLYGLARDLPEDALVVESRAPSEIETDIALELARLDPGEWSATLTRDGGRTLLFVMLCGRTIRLDEDATLEEIQFGLRNRRLETLAQSYLAQLRADARIREK